MLLLSNLSSHQVAIICHILYIGKILVNCQRVSDNVHGPLVMLAKRVLLSYE